MRLKESEIKFYENALINKERELKQKEKLLNEMMAEEEKEVSLIKWTISECQRLSKHPRNSKEFQDGLRNLYTKLTPVKVAHYDYIINPLIKRNQ